MRHWLFISARFPRAGPGIDVAAYEGRVHDLVGMVNIVFGRAFDGARWLGRRFPPRTYLDIAVHVQAESGIRVERLRNRNYEGAKALRYRLWVPAAWFAEPGDGLLGIRLFRAVLALLTTLGVERDLGPPPLRSAAADPGRPEPVDLFSPGGSPPPRFAPIARRLLELTERADPGQLVLAGLESVPEPVRRARAVVTRDLGATEEEVAVALTERERLRVWTLRMRD